MENGERGEKDEGKKREGKERKGGRIERPGQGRKGNIIILVG